MARYEKEIEIKIEREETLPFPLVDEPITGTLTDDQENNGWNRVRNNLQNDNSKTQAANKWKGVMDKSKVFFGVDSSNEQKTSPNAPIYINKTLVNWNERTFKLLKKNKIFGGKLKKGALEDYINNLDEEILDEGDSYGYFKSTNKVLPRSKELTKHIFKSNAEAEDDRPRYMKERYDQDFGDSQPPQARTVNYLPEEEQNIEGPCDAFTHACTGKRIPGIGFFGRLFDFNLSPDKQSEFDKLINTAKNHRAYFTYWVTFVHVLILIGAFIAYGNAPFGFSSTYKKGMVTTINLEKQLMNYQVKDNSWFGPSAVDLVHLGAKYAPCMRNDSNIHKQIEQDRLNEKETACCIRNDRGGCVQTNKEKCSQLFSRWDKWGNKTETSESRKRTSGSVCGQDPDFCSDPDSQKWPDDITQWPICSKPTSVFNSSLESNEHMFCEVIGRPCCIGLQGECLITTLEHCDMMKGYFHAEASLCSQVDCMQDACGMMDFLNPKSPDQVYRVFTSIFIHAGLIQLLITIVFQLFILRDLENLAGCLRVGIIYTGSGVLGNLASAIFLPYQAEAGPAASHFGILACSFIELFHIWKLYENPWIPFAKLFAFLVALLIVGLLPMIDNFANIFGFISGLLLGAIFFPNVTLNGKCKRIIILSTCICILIAYIGALVVLFYIKPLNDCKWCKFISCPFGSKYCLDMDFNVTRIGDFNVTSL